MKPLGRLRRLYVFRTFADGSRALAGELARNERGETFFSYAPEYLEAGLGSLSPYKVPLQPGLCPGPASPWSGLHGVFADSLPDGWGLLLQDRAMRSAGLDPVLAHPLERLALVGGRGIGALSYEPAEDEAEAKDEISILSIGTGAERVLEGETKAILPELLQSGASGGSRPKALLHLSEDGEQAALSPFEGSTPWLLKFTSTRTPLGHEEGIAEAVSLALAKKAGIEIPDWHLFPGRQGPGRPCVPYWLGMRRFDCTERGRLHRLSASGLLDADFRAPSLDYAALVQVTRTLIGRRAATEEFVRRALFNWFFVNQDDHGRNFSFLQDDDGRWCLSPAYDITFSPNPVNLHETALCGCNRTITAEAAKRFAKLAGVSFRQLKEIAGEVAEAIAAFPEAADNLGLSEDTVRRIWKDLLTARTENGPAFGIAKD